MSFRGQRSDDNATGRTATNPYPWLRALAGGPEEAQEPDEDGEAVVTDKVVDADAASVAALLAHLRKIGGRLAQVQARLAIVEATKN